jgi:hypothetical protein
MVKKLNVLVEDDLDKRFRDAVFQKKGYRQGNISEALIEAIENWIKIPKQESQPQPQPQTHPQSQSQSQPQTQ